MATLKDLFARKDEIVKMFVDAKMSEIVNGYNTPVYFTTKDGMWTSAALEKVYYEEGCKFTKLLLKANKHRSYIKWSTADLAKATGNEKKEIEQVRAEIMKRSKNRLEKEFGHFIALAEEYKDIWNRINAIRDGKSLESDAPLNFNVGEEDDEDTTVNVVKHDISKPLVFDVGENDDFDLTDI